jgi:hypothetical protein
MAFIYSIFKLRTSVYVTYPHKERCVDPSTYYDDETIYFAVKVGWDK